MEPEGLILSKQGAVWKSFQILGLEVHMQQYSGHFLKARKSVRFVFLPVLEINTIAHIVLEDCDLTLPFTAALQGKGPVNFWTAIPQMKKAGGGGGRISVQASSCSFSELGLGLRLPACKLSSLHHHPPHGLLWVSPHSWKMCLRGMEIVAISLSQRTER